MATPFPSQPQTNDVITPRVAAAGAGATWWADGWRIFTSSLGTWILIIVVYFVLEGLLDSVPRVGTFASWLLTPVFAGGLMLGCAALGRGEPLRVSHLFDGFKGAHFVSLLLVGVFNMLLCVLAVVVCVVVIVAGVGISGFSDMTALANDPWRILPEFGLSFLLLVVVAIVVTAVLAMANWFAAALIVLRGVRPLAAMKTSLYACMRNWVPFLVYGLIGLGIIIVFGGLFAVALGVMGFELFMTIAAGAFDWKSLGLGVVALVAIGIASTIVAAAVIFGSTWASYRDTLAPELSGADNPPAI